MSKVISEQKLDVPAEKVWGLLVDLMRLQIGTQQLKNLSYRMEAIFAH